MVYTKRGDWSNRGMSGKKKTIKSIKKQSQTRKKRIANGKIKIWNKGLIFKDKKYKVAHCFVNGKQMLRSHKVWTSQKENLPYFPKGFVIHHLDGNPLNDNPKNLLLLDRGTHQRLHIKINMEKLKGRNGGGITR
jgi:hypothetical protein